MGWPAVIVAILTLVTMGLNAYHATSPARKKEDLDEADQKLRKECLDLDADAVSVYIDDIVRDIPASTADNPPVVSDGQVAGGIGGTL